MTRILGDRKKGNLEEVLAYTKKLSEEKDEAPKAEAPSAIKASAVIEEPSVEDIVDFYGTPLCRNDYDALKETYHSMDASMKTAKGANRIGIQGKRIVRLSPCFYDWENLPDYIAKLTKLEYLNMDGNQIAVLPGWMEKMPCLNQIIATNNPLNDISKQMLQRMKSRGVIVTY